MKAPRPPTPEEEDEFYAALGRAITDWAALERELFELTASMLHSKRTLAAVVFYRTPMLASRLNLTNDLIYAALPQHKPGEHPHEAIKAWKKLEGDIKEKLPIRNQLAHHDVGPIFDVYESADGKTHQIETRFGSYGGIDDHSRKPGQRFPILDLKDVQKHLANVAALLGRLQRFRRTHGEALRSASSA